MDHLVQNPEPVFDLQGTLRRLGGDRELLAQLITFCLTDAQPLVASLRNAIESRDGLKIRKDAHALKGLVAGCGGVQAASVAQKLERTGESCQLDDAPHLYEILIEKLERFQQALNDYHSDTLRK